MRKRWPLRIYVGYQDGDLVCDRIVNHGGVLHTSRRRGISHEVALAIGYTQYIRGKQVAELQSLLERWLALGMNVKGIRPIQLDRDTRRALAKLRR